MIRTLVASCPLLALMVLPSRAADTDWQRVDQILARPAAVSGTVHRCGLPRSDLKVVVDGVTLKPGSALGGWRAFEPMGDGAMRMGGLVLTEPEVSPVLTKLIDQGIQVTAIHNHLQRADPPTLYMHVAGQGEPIDLARKLRVGLEQSATPLDVGLSSGLAPVTPDLGIATAEVDGIIGSEGKANAGVYEFGVPRPDVMMQDGMAIPAAMGVAIVINFQPTGDSKAAVTGGFVALADEVNPLIRALRDNGIEITAIHNHMLDDSPRAFFVHYWANDDAVKLAKALRAALDAVHAGLKP